MINQTITELHQTISDRLKAEYHEDHIAHEYAWWILESISGKNKAILLAHDIAPFSQNDFHTINTWLEKITQEHIPLQYLIGSVPFDGVEILVEPPILIPRQETEEWCSILIRKLLTLENKNISILDLATGSGCIAIAIGFNIQRATIHATDISKDALALAKRNGIFNGISNVTFFYSDLFSNITDKYDLIISNPPYIRPDEWVHLEKSVKNWEDKNALVAQDDGLYAIESIIKNAAYYIQDNKEFTQKNIPNLWIEIGYTQGQETVAIMQKYGIENIQIHQDMSGKDRYTVGTVKAKTD